MKKGIVDIGQLKKQFVPTLQSAALRTVGTVGVSVLSNKLIKPMLVASPNLVKLEGPGALLLGIVGEAITTNPYVKNVFQGVQAYGGMQTAAAFLPKDFLGIAGLGETEENYQANQNIQGLDALASFDAQMAALSEYATGETYQDQQRRENFQGVEDLTGYEDLTGQGAPMGL